MCVCVCVYSPHLYIYLLLYFIVSFLKDVDKFYIQNWG
jgi:hypothetical protein